MKRPAIRNALLWCAAVLFSLTVWISAHGVTVDEIDIIPKVELEHGALRHSGDLAINPVDKSLHILWVYNGDIKYKVRNADGTFSATEIVPDGGLEVFGMEEMHTADERPRKCIAMAIDKNGITHLVFGTRDKGIFYMSGTPHNWSSSRNIVKPYTSTCIHFDLIITDEKMVATYEVAELDYLYFIVYKNGSWGSPARLGDGSSQNGRGEGSFLYATPEGYVYFLSRNRNANPTPRNLLFGYMAPGTTKFSYKFNFADPESDGAETVNLTVAGGKIYAAWSDTHEDAAGSTTKFYCATAKEPGSGTWTKRIGGTDPIWTTNTSAPHSRVEAFKDGTVFYTNGRRSNRKWTLWNGSQWSSLQAAPWAAGAIQVISDGSTIWALITPHDMDNDFEVSLTGFKASVGADHIDKLVLQPKQILDQSGWSGDLAYNPVDGSVHAGWVHNGDIYYSYKEQFENWSAVSTIPDGGKAVGSKDQGNFDRNCLAIDVDEQGIIHVVFGVSNEVYYTSGTPGNWAAPVKIATQAGSNIFHEIIAIGQDIYVAYESTASTEIIVIKNHNGSWSDRRSMGNGNHPHFARGENGMLYLVYQNNMANKDVVFASLIPNFTDWVSVANVTDVQNLVGDGVGIAVGQRKIYIGWNNDTGIEGSSSSELFCAAADEPGQTWQARLGQNNPLYYENTTDPYPTPSVYGNGEVLYINGRRESAHFVLWDGNSWSKTRSAQWSPGMPDVENDGQTAWILVSSTSSTTAEVSVTPIENPSAGRNPLLAHWPVIITQPDTLAGVNQQWSYDCQASDMDGDVLEYNLIKSPDGMTIDNMTGLVQWTPDQSDRSANPYGRGAGVHLVGIQVTDHMGGNRWQYFWLHVVDAVQNHPPEITSSPVTSGQAGSPYQYNVTAYDQDGDELSFDLTQAPATMVIHPVSGVLTWNPGDGNVGSHTVTVRVLDGRGGSDTQTFLLNVTPAVIQSPVANFIGQPNQGQVPLAVQFTDQSTGVITSWFWNFGDGGSSTAQNPNHVFNLIGNYTVTLTVTGPGGSNTMTRQEYIQASNVPPPAPVAGFSATPVAGQKPLSVQFTDTSTGSISSYLWNFGDGSTSNAQNPQHIYNNAGLYTVVLTVTGPGGSNSMTRNNYIQVFAGEVILANFTAIPRSGSKPLTVEFHNASTGNVTNWSWNFGDSGTSININPIHTYNNSGSYTVTLTVTGPAGSNTMIQENYIVVTETPPVANFAGTPTSGLQPLSVQFTDQSIGFITNWLWNFGDGATSSDRHPLHVYQTPGIYDVALLVTGPGGSNTKVLDDYITVHGQPPVAAFTADPLTGNVPLSVQFSDQSTGDITSWLWNFGDQTILTERNPRHVFTQPGVYAVILIVAGPAGSDIETKENYIHVLDTKPHAYFGATPEAGLVPLTVQFTDSSSGNISAWVWDFGDHSSSTERNPQHTYTAPGYYSVALNVIGPFGSDLYTRQNFIRVTETKPIAQFSATPRNGGIPLSVQFIDQSIGTVNSWTWNFGDQTTSNEKNPIHIYNTIGNYPITLTVSGPGGSDTKTIENYIQVLEPAPVANFFASPLEGNVPLIVQFTDISQGVVSSWVWDFGDGSNASYLQNPGHLFSQSGRYTVRLTVIGPGGTDTEIKEGYIVVHPPAPRPDFTASQVEGDRPLIVQFQDLTMGSVTTWIWDFGDGTLGQGQNPTHMYMNEGVYSVKLTVSGPGGSNDMIKLNFIKVNLPSGVVQNDAMPTTFGLYQNYPNPFNGNTTIEYQVPEPVESSLSIYDIRGNLICRLYQGKLAPGHYKTSWNGLDDNGSAVASGVYLVRFKAGSFTADQKVIYIK